MVARCKFSLRRRLLKFTYVNGDGEIKIGRDDGYMLFRGAENLENVYVVPNHPTLNQYKYRLPIIHTLKKNMCHFVLADI